MLEGCIPGMSGGKSQAMEGCRRAVFLSCLSTLLDLKALPDQGPPGSLCLPLKQARLSLDPAAEHCCLQSLPESKTTAFICVTTRGFSNYTAPGFQQQAGAFANEALTTPFMSSNKFFEK